jgi:hypothetical protein
MEQENSPAEDRAELEVVFTANGEIEAQTIKSALVAAGIPAEIKMEAAQQLFAVTVNGLGAVKVLVPADRLEEARAILDNPAAPIEEVDQSE